MSAALNRYAERRRALRAPRAVQPSARGPRREGPPARSFRTAGAVEQPDGSVLISAGQAKVHRVTETLAVFVLAPMQIWLGLQKTYPIPGWMRAASITFGVGTIVVDGGLRLAFANAKKAQAGACAPYASQQRAGGG